MIVPSERQSIVPPRIQQATRPTRARLGILLLLSTGTAINYLDRSIMGIAAPGISAELGLDAATMGLVFSAFSWSYVLMQIPGGVLLDRLGTRVVYCCSVGGWSLMTLLHALAGGLGSLLGLRLALGAAEAPCFPANGRAVATWFPRQERARATGAYTIGEYVGLALLTPLLVLLMQHAGWRVLFLVCGLLGLCFSVVWWRGYREPTGCARIDAAELAHIRAGGGDAGHALAPARFRWRNVGRLLRSRRIMGACIGQFASNSTLVFFLTWFPTYLQRERGIAAQDLSWFAATPFLAAAVGVIVGSCASDRMTARLGSATWGCKIPVVGGLLLCASIALANHVADNRVVIGILSLAFFGQGMASLGWTVISNIAPPRLLGLAGGLFSLAANLAGVITPLLVGAIVSRTGSFHGALYVIGATALVGVFAFGWLLDEVEPLVLPATD